VSQDHISTAQQAVDQDRFDDNFSRIFNTSAKVKGGTFVYCPVEKKMVPRGTSAARVDGPRVQRGLKEFKSPIDGQMITSRAGLAAHNKKHGVTNASDYSKGYIEKKAHARVEGGKKYLRETRRPDIARAIDQHTR